jgi:hypothetical protein
MTFLRITTEPPAICRQEIPPGAFEMDNMGDGLNFTLGWTILHPFLRFLSFFPLLALAA